MTTICSCGIYSRYSHVFVDSHCTTMFDRGFSTKERVTLAKRLAFLVRAGVPIIQGLYILKKQAGSKSKILLLERVIADVSNGQFLSSSFAKFKNIFDQYDKNWRGKRPIGPKFGIFSRGTSKKTIVETQNLERIDVPIVYLDSHAG